MSDNPIIGIKEQQRRRRRINRMKRAIIWTIVLWMLLSMVSLGFLFYRVISLNKKFNKLYDYLTNQLSQETTVDVEPEDLSKLVLDDIDEDAVLNYTHKEDDTQSTEKRVYLTFDDGPSDNTDAILDLLKQYDVKATFFVVGKTDEHSLNMYKRIVEEGHTIGLHSYSHNYADIYQSVDAFCSDLDRIHQLIFETTGVNSTIIRFPGGSSNQVSPVDMKEFIRVVSTQGYRYFDWNVMSGDATTKSYTAQDLVNNVLAGVKNKKHAVVLMHDATNKTSTVEALETILSKLKEDGYEMLAIDENTELVQHIDVDSVVNE